MVLVALDAQTFQRVKFFRVDFVEPNLDPYLQGKVDIESPMQRPDLRNHAVQHIEFTVIATLAPEKTTILPIVVLIDLDAVITTSWDANLISPERPMNQFLEAWLLR